MKPSEAIKIIKGLIASVELAYKANPLTDKEPHHVTDALTIAIFALEKLEQDRWIPVSKDLPKKNGDYLVTCEVCGERYVEESFFCRCDDGEVFWTSQNVIAWQPRIEPYTAEEKE